MSVSGRNRWRGARCQVLHHPADAQGAGAQTTRVWILFLADVYLELLSITDELARTIFGVDEAITLTVVVPRSLGIGKGFGIIVSEGEYAGERFEVLEARSLHILTELGLSRSTDPMEVLEQLEEA